MPQSPAVAFAAWMSAMRDQRGLTLEQLEDRTGIKKQHLSVLERATPHSLTGKPVVPKRGTVEKIAAGLAAPLNEAMSAAGYARSDESVSPKEKLANELSKHIMSSGFDDLEDEALRESFLADMRSIAESMLKRKLEEQEQKHR